MRTYTSCNCKTCRKVPSSVKQRHKREAHRTLRRESKRAIQKDTEAPTSICTGYKD
jgi:hypothetical protein